MPLFMRAEFLELAFERVVAPEAHQALAAIDVDRAMFAGMVHFEDAVRAVHSCVMDRITAAASAGGSRITFSYSVVAMAQTVPRSTPRSSARDSSAVFSPNCAYMSLMIGVSSGSTRSRAGTATGCSADVRITSAIRTSVRC